MRKGDGVIIVGAGGIGSALLQDLCRFLRHDIDIHLVDGDTVQGKNLQRQHFSKKDLGRNKAEALTERATVSVGLARVYFHPVYLTDPKQLRKIALPYQRLILVGCVDNHPARRVMENFVQEADLPVFYVDCANEEDRGEIVTVYAGLMEIEGCMRSELDPQVLTDTTGDPTQRSCTEELDSGNVQVLYTNRKAAILALEIIASHLKGQTLVGVSYFKDCVVSRQKAVTDSGPAAVAST